MATTDHTTGSAESDGLRIHFRRFGAPGKTPIIVVHGLSYTSYDWIDVAAALATDREVVAIDMRGFGDSDWSPKRDYSIPANARDLTAVMDGLGWNRAILLGHSMGGRYCTYCATKSRNRVAALILVDFAPSNDPKGAARVAETVGNTPDYFPSIEAAIAYYGQDPHSKSGAGTRERYENYLKSTEHGYQVKRDTHFRDQFKRVLETGERPKPAIDMWEVMAEVAVPSLILRGTKSDMFSPAILERVRKTVPSAEIVEIDAGHNIAGENRAAFLAAVSGFLTKH